MNVSQRNFRSRLRTHRRHGAFLTELLVAMSLLSALAATALPLSIKISRARGLHQERLIAVEELANQLDRLCRLPANQLDTIDPQSLLTDDVTGQLTAAELQLVLTPQTPNLGQGRRLDLTLRWQNRLGNRDQLIMTTWVYPARSHKDNQ
jgi:Tfp pilus assembly protein FimT